MSGSVETRRYEVSAASTSTFGRVLWSCRDQHFVADGPVHNGCPGEAVTPAELFLAGIATCGVELVEVIARAEGIPLQAARARSPARSTPTTRCGATSASSTGSGSRSAWRA